ncbi:MAG TPA: DUF4166 domain-containing protein [Ramlibacter sp.]|nr:DUF4166 domain-containing protein [Ramlibacter sp.]
MGGGSMFQQAMGEAFGRLHPALQRFHSLRGQVELHGEVQVSGPRGRLARVLAWLLRSPPRDRQGPIRFRLDAGPLAETWVREFPGRTMASRLRLAGTQLTEHFGAVRLSFDVVEAQGGLQMRHRAMRVLGLPLPRWLQPRIEAHEHGEGDRLCFDVSADYPLAGRVVRYRGWLALAPMQDNRSP